MEILARNALIHCQLKKLKFGYLLVIVQNIPQTGNNYIGG